MGGLLYCISRIFCFLAPLHLCAIFRKHGQNEICGTYSLVNLTKRVQNSKIGLFIHKHIKLTISLFLANFYFYSFRLKRVKNINVKLNLMPHLLYACLIKAAVFKRCLVTTPFYASGHFFMLRK